MINNNFSPPSRPSNPEQVSSSSSAATPKEKKTAEKQHNTLQEPAHTPSKTLHRHPLTPRHGDMSPSLFGHSLDHRTGQSDVSHSLHKPPSKALQGAYAYPNRAHSFHADLSSQSGTPKLGLIQTTYLPGDSFELLRDPSSSYHSTYSILEDDSPKSKGHQGSASLLAIDSARSDQMFSFPPSPVRSEAAEIQIDIDSLSQAEHQGLAIKSHSENYQPLDFCLSPMDIEGLHKIGHRIYSTMSVDDEKFVVSGIYNRILDPETGNESDLYIESDHNNNTRIAEWDASIEAIAAHTAINIDNNDIYSLSDHRAIPENTPGKEKPIFQGSNIKLLTHKDKLIILNSDDRIPLLKLEGVRRVGIDSTTHKNTDDNPQAIPSWPRRLGDSIVETHTFHGNKKPESAPTNTKLPPTQGRSTELTFSPNRIKDQADLAMGKVRVVVQYKNRSTDVFDFNKANTAEASGFSRVLNSGYKTTKNGWKSSFPVNYNGNNNTLVLADGKEVPAARLLVDEKVWRGKMAQMGQLVHQTLGLGFPGMTKTTTGTLAVTGIATYLSILTGQASGLISQPINKSFLPRGTSATIFGTGSGGQQAANKLFEVWNPVATVLNIAAQQIEQKHPQLYTLLTNLGLTAAVQIGIAIQGTANGAIANAKQAIVGQIIPPITLIMSQLGTDWMIKEGLSPWDQKAMQGLSRLVLFNVVNATCNAATHPAGFSAPIVGGLAVSSAAFNILEMARRCLATELSRYHVDEQKMNDQLDNWYQQHQVPLPPGYAISSGVRSIEDGLHRIGSTLWSLVADAGSNASHKLFNK